MMILATLVATPAADLFAQSNPWYIPPQTTPQVQHYQVAPQGFQQPVQQAYPAAPQYGFGAGYAGQAPVAQGYASPQAVVPVPAGQATQAAGAGIIYTAPALGGVTAYAPQIYTIPQLQAPMQQAPSQQAVPQFVPQHQYAAPQYQGAAPMQPPHILGNYPPLGSDPTVPQQPAQSNARADVRQPATAGNVLPQYPGFAGPTTLTPGYGGGYGGLPMYPAPFGASPYLGLPFY